MELYLIRHGETVDNVAGLYAGVRDSALTNHGHQQAQRLGEHFAKTNVTFTHIFASPLTRAFKTAQAIQSQQTAKDSLTITKVPDLIEQDFGYYEGKPFQARTDARKTGKESHREKHKDDPGFVDVESKDSMNARADKFLDEHIMPLFNEDKKIVAIVSHGMLLSHLWRRLLLRLPAKSVTIAPEVVAARGDIVLQHLGGWSNTGYLELVLSPPAKAAVVEKAEQLVNTPDASSKDIKHTAEAGEPGAVEHLEIEAIPASFDPSNGEHSAAITKAAETKSAAAPSVDSLASWSTLIRAIDSKAHLVGLKRQRGGIGRSVHDEGQKKLDGFFKRQRTS